MKWWAVREGSMRSDATELSRRRSLLLVTLLVAIAVAFEAVVLFPEVEYTAPNHNDEVFHYLFLQRADQAISAGDNPVDHWLPEVELGFPQFLYYQNLPHLSILALYRLLLRQVSLLRLLNLVRYLLMVAFPLTVYWSMRRMEFSQLSAAAAAAFAPMVSSSIPFSFDYDSYVWGGYGMLPQLYSMHLMFISAACVTRVLRRSQGYCAAIVASAAMVLSDLIYAYIFALLVVILWLISIVTREGGSRSDRGLLAGVYRSSVRLTAVMVPAAAIAAYQTLPLLYQIQYVNLAALQRWKFKWIAPSGGHAVKHSILHFPIGDFFDYRRLPVFALLVLAGVLYGVIKRPKGAALALGLLIGWSLIFLGGPLRHLLPLSGIIPVIRLATGIDFSAILTAGLGGELLWIIFAARPTRLRIIAPLALFALLYAPAVVERWNYLHAEKTPMEATEAAYQDDRDLARIFSTLRASPPGRVYAGTRANWGDWMSDADVHLFDLLPIEGFDTVMPWQTLSLNSPYLWKLATPDLGLCRLYNIKYVIAPPGLEVPDGYKSILTTDRYVLYAIDSGGYAQLVHVNRIAAMGTSQNFYAYNRNWLAAADLWKAGFTAFTTGDGESEPALDGVVLGDAGDDIAGLGTLEHEVIGPDSMRVEVDAQSAAVLIFKITYHPNWHVLVDGREQPAFMVSPSFLATMVSNGHHQVVAEYRSSNFKKGLMGIGAIILIAILTIWMLGLEESTFRVA